MKKTWFVFLIVAAVLLTMACGNDDDENNNTEDSIRVGAVIPLTGGLEAYGVAARQSIELAVKEVNDAGGIDGKTVDLIIEDSGLDSEIAVPATQRLIDDNCLGIIGAVSSGVTIPVANEATIINSIPQITISTSPEITGLEDNNMLWRTTLSDIYAGTAMATYSAEELNETEVSILNIDNPYGNGIASQYQSRFEESGGTVRSSTTYPDLGGDYTDYEFEPHLVELFAERPNTVVIIGYGSDGQQLLDDFQAWQSAIAPEYDPRIICSDTWQSGAITDNVSFDVLDNIIGSITSPQVEENSPFYQNHLAMHDAVPGPYGVNFYDATMALLLAIEAAESTDGPSIAAQLSNIAQGGQEYRYDQIGDCLTAINNGEDVNYQGASGPISFDANGDLTEGVIRIWRFVEGSDGVGFETVSQLPVQTEN